MLCDSASSCTDWVSGSEPASGPRCRQESSSDVVPSRRTAAKCTSCFRLPDRDRSARAPSRTDASVYSM
ncbi:hypothetical protein BC628DRAFT_1361872 [Trametes gibbosa]|nr:hypothetical protein BC628DRAFT_1361872 [Trametes gibbosa]